MKMNAVDEPLDTLSERTIQFETEHTLSLIQIINISMIKINYI